MNYNATNHSAEKTYEIRKTLNNINHNINLGKYLKFFKMYKLFYKMYINAYLYFVSRNGLMALVWQYDTSHINSIIIVHEL